MPDTFCQIFVAFRENANGSFGKPSGRTHMRRFPSTGTMMGANCQASSSCSLQIIEAHAGTDHCVDDVAQGMNP